MSTPTETKISSAIFVYDREANTMRAQRDELRASPFGCLVRDGHEFVGFIMVCADTGVEIPMTLRAITIAATSGTVETWEFAAAPGSLEGPAVMLAGLRVIVAAASTFTDADSIQCPWCGDDQGDLWEYDLSKDGQSVKAECGSCARPFRLTASVSIDYIAHPLPISL